MEPISFDYRVSNLCNFKCRMCGEPLSSAWEGEKRKHNLWSPENQPFMVPENKKIIQKFQKEVVEEEFWDAICRGIVEEIYWVGGEPLMYDIHWRSMDRLAKDNNLNKVHKSKQNKSFNNHRNRNKNINKKKILCQYNIYQSISC